MASFSYAEKGYNLAKIVIILIKNWYDSYQF